MKNTLSTSEIVAALLSDDYAKWTHEAAQALAEYLEEYEKECDIELELDVVAIRCEFNEFGSLQDWAEARFTDEELADLLDGEALADSDEKIRDYIQDHSQLIEFSGGIIVSEF